MELYGVRRRLADASTNASYLPQGAAVTPPPDPATLAMLHEMSARALAKYRGLLLVLAVGYGIVFLLSVALVVYLRRNRTVAFRGDSSAARKIILPAYLPLLLMLTAMALVYSAYFWVLHALTTSADRVAGDVENEIYFSGRLFFMLIVVVYMYQKSVTAPALKRATLATLLLSTYSIPVVWFAGAYLHNADVAHWVPQFARILIVVFILWVLVMPPERASKRSLREYCAFVLVYYALFFAYSELFHQSQVDAGFLLAYANILWGALCPLVIWRVLKADTEHWRGLGHRAVALQSLFRQKHRMDERISSRGLHVLIEMHRKYIIDFAYLELKHKIGMGSSAVVFNGVLHNKTPVAVKVYSPSELTDEVVAEFSHEAALCGALHHPNVVKFYGMCVCPPTICLVSELCQGSLDDVTRSIARRPHDASRQQLMIDLNYMIDATRAVAYLHSFAPAFLHRDIKPSNFLVDRKCVVKLTDFGESRSLPRELGGGSVLSNAAAAAQDAPLDCNDTALLTRLSLDGWQGGDGSGGVASTPARRPAMTVRGTAEYMAPELIQGKAGTALYGAAADIFSLAMTLWDIAYPLDDKYPAAQGNHLKVFEAVLGGARPAFHGGLHPELCGLLASAWDARPEARPSALAMLTALERIHAQVCGEPALVLASAMDKKILISRKGCTTEPSSAGQDLVQKMLEFDVVASVDEAVRAGNGLMSAGLLHHACHTQGFENSAEQFLFDEALDALLSPPPERLHATAALLPIVERRHGSSPSSSSAVAAFTTASTTQHTSPGDGDDEGSTLGDLASDYDRDHDHDGDDHDDGESVFGRSVGPQVGRDKTDEGREVESAGVAAAIGHTVCELLRFGPRRKLSRAGSSSADDDAQQHQRRALLAAQPPSYAVASQWTDTTNAEPSVCPCRRLGAGMMYISKRGHSSGGGGSAMNKRFRRTKRAPGSGSFVGDASQIHGFSRMTSGVSGGRVSRSMTQSGVDSGLTARLLMNEFSNTGGSEPYADSPVQTPLSASDVEMDFHVADASGEDEDEDELRHRGVRPARRADSHGSSTLDGSSSVESSTVVHPVDMA